MDKCILVWLNKTSKIRIRTCIEMCGWMCIQGRDTDREADGETVDAFVRVARFTVVIVANQK